MRIRYALVLDVPQNLELDENSHLAKKYLLGLQHKLKMVENYLIRTLSSGEE